MLSICSALWLQDAFWLAEYAMWYTCIGLESRKKSGKVWQAYEIGYYQGHQSSSFIAYTSWIKVSVS